MAEVTPARADDPSEKVARPQAQHPTFAASTKTYIVNEGERFSQRGRTYNAGEEVQVADEKFMQFADRLTLKPVDEQAADEPAVLGAGDDIQPGPPAAPLGTPQA
jgi:hypothetical protein